MNYLTLNLLFQSNREYGRRQARLLHLSDTECMICSYLKFHNNCSQEEISSSMHLEKTTVAKAMAALEKKTLVERDIDPTDKRRKQIRLTPSGTKKVSQIIQIHDEWFHTIFQCLSEEEQNQFDSCSKKLLEAANHLL